MIFYVLLNQITTIFLSLNLLTTLSFTDEITSYMYGGPKEEVFFELTNGQSDLLNSSIRKLAIVLFFKHTPICIISHNDKVQKVAVHYP